MTNGFQLAYRNIRFQRVAQGIGQTGRQADLLEASALPFDVLNVNDRQCFPAARERSLAAWLAQPDAIARRNARRPVCRINRHALALAERHGMTSVFETARMYTQASPAISTERRLGMTSFELG